MCTGSIDKDTEREKDGYAHQATHLAMNHFLYQDRSKDLVFF
jgi:hypothetical protein